MRTQLKVLKSFSPYKAGQIINVELDQFWRRRLLDGSAEKYVAPKKAVKGEGDSKSSDTTGESK